MGTQSVGRGEFNALHFEKTLLSLKDSQEAINSCCKWCLENRTHHKKIVNAWLNVLKRVKVEQRLTLFYLANDVVQYSKRKNYEYVESWGTALQKATTMVRDEKVKHKVLRIFKIWEQRNVYNEEFITDLCGLLNVVPSSSKGDEPHEFQAAYVINKIKTCSKLETDTDTKLKLLKEHNPKIQLDEHLLGSLKDRAHIDDVEQEVEMYVKHMEAYINALKLEIKNRISLISVLKQAETQLEADRKDVKLVANAYRMFGTRVKTFQKKLEEHKETLNSPVPSPDVNAPSPSSNSDLDLPDDINVMDTITAKKGEINAYNPKAELQQFYNPLAPPVASPPSSVKDGSFTTNGFTSFIGSNMHFSMKSFTQSGPPMPVEAPPISTIANTNAYPYTTGHLPLLPPPMPPFKSDDYTTPEVGYPVDSAKILDSSYVASGPALFTGAPTPSYSSTTSENVAGFQEETYEPPAPDAFRQKDEFNPDAYNPDEYNPEETSELWQSDPTWANIEPPSQLDTPESPPSFEREGYTDPVEYHDNVARSGVQDIDQRVLPPIGDIDDSLSSLGGKDIDHRNLISLTGSPGNSNPDVNSSNSWGRSDQDYRSPNRLKRPTGDRDYRLNFDLDQLKLPPPPPPPPRVPQVGSAPPPPPLPPFSKSPRKVDNVESIDMDLSDEDIESRLQTKHDNLKVIVDSSLQPPPPLPDLPDDIDANNFLDDLSNDLNEFSSLTEELSNNESNSWGAQPQQQQPQQKKPLLSLPPPMLGSFDNLMNPPPPIEPQQPPPPRLHDGHQNTNVIPPPMLPLMPPPQPSGWLGNEEEQQQQWGNDGENWGNDGENWGGDDQLGEEDGYYQQEGNWMGNHGMNSNNKTFGFRGRGGNRGNFWQKSRGRGINNRGNRGFQPRGGFMPRGRGNWSRGNFRGNFRGGF